MSTITFEKYCTALDLNSNSKHTKLPSAAQSEAYNRYKARKSFRTSANRFIKDLYTLGTPEQVTAAQSLIRDVRTNLRNSLHKFTVCPICYHALYRRPPTSRFKNFTYQNCSICNSTSSNKTNLLIRYKHTLLEATIDIQTNHPELSV